MSSHITTTSVRALTTMTITMLALCSTMGAEELPQVAASEPSPTETAATSSDSQVAAHAADLHYQQGLAALEKLDLTSAIKDLTLACDWQPENQTYRAALMRAKALAGVSRDPRSLQVERLSDEQNVRQQELWIEAQARIQEGEKATARGDFAEAERAFSMAQIRIENMPYADSRRESEVRRIETLLKDVQTKHAAQERVDAADRSNQALDRQKELRSATLKIERDRIDALLRRAQKARERRDYDEAILLAENVLKINRAESRAQNLLVRCRRERHVYLRQVTADRWDEEHKLLSENIRASMLPQLELVNYSPDWYMIDKTRSAPNQGLEVDNEEWRKNIQSQLEQKVTVTFDGKDLVETVDFLQKLTGVNIILDQAVIAGNPPVVNLRVTDMQLKFVLDYIMTSTSLNYTLRDEAIFISNAAGVRGALTTKFFDIRDLTHELVNYPGPDLSIPEGANTGVVILPAVATPREKQTVNSFIEIVKKVVAPTQWDEASGASIEEYNGQMVVSHSAAVHAEIERLLRTLRNQQATQVHIKVKFLQIENRLLEEIGVNWDNYTAGGVNGGAPLPALATGSASGFGAFHEQGSVVAAAQTDTTLQPYTAGNALGGMDNSGGATISSQYWNVANRFYISAVLNAVEKDRRGNILFEPDLTMFNGQQAHIVHLNQQAYISDYDVTGSQYMPIISTLSTGTVLDVQPIVSADKKYITLTVRPTNAQIDVWRRFGRANAQITNGSSFGDGQVQDSPTSGINGGETPLMIPIIKYEAVRTSVTIPDGGSIMLAGLNGSASKRSHSGIPFLSHIPFLGRLFSSNGRDESELKTLVVLQADVILYDEIEKKL